MISKLLHVLWVFAFPTWAQATTVAEANSEGNFIASFAIQALFEVSGNPLDLSNGSFQGALNSSGTFVNGPWGMDSGAILTTGFVSGASFPSTHQSTNNNFTGISFCGADSFDAAILTMDVTLSTGYSGITSTLVYATNDPRDLMVVLVDGIQVASLTMSDLGILSPVTSTMQTHTGFLTGSTSGYDMNLDFSRGSDLESQYDLTSYPLYINHTTVPGSHSLTFVLCDLQDALFDSAVFINNVGAVAGSVSTRPSSTSLTTSMTSRPAVSVANYSPDKSVTHSTGTLPASTHSPNPVLSFIITNRNSSSSINSFPSSTKPSPSSSSSALIDMITVTSFNTITSKDSSCAASSTNHPGQDVSQLSTVNVSTSRLQTLAYSSTSILRIPSTSLTVSSPLTAPTILEPSTSSGTASASVSAESQSSHALLIPGLVPSASTGSSLMLIPTTLSPTIYAISTLKSPSSVTSSTSPPAISWSSSWTFSTSLGKSNVSHSKNGSAPSSSLTPATTGQTQTPSTTLVYQVYETADPPGYPISSQSHNGAVLSSPSLTYFTTIGLPTLPGSAVGVAISTQTTGNAVFQTSVPMQSMGMASSDEPQASVELSQITPTLLLSLTSGIVTIAFGSSGTALSSASPFEEPSALTLSKPLLSTVRKSTKAAGSTMGDIVTISNPASTTELSDVNFSSPQSVTQGTHNSSSSGLPSLSPPPPSSSATMTALSPPTRPAVADAPSITTILEDSGSSLDVMFSPPPTLSSSMTPPGTDMQQLNLTPPISTIAIQSESSSTVEGSLLVPVTVFSTTYIAEYTTITVAEVHTPAPPRVLSTKTVTVCPACTSTENASMEEPSALAGIRTPYYAPHATTEAAMPSVTTPSAPAETQPTETPTDAQILHENTSEGTSSPFATETAVNSPLSTHTKGDSASASTSEGLPFTASSTAGSLSHDPAVTIIESRPYSTVDVDSPPITSARSSVQTAPALSSTDPDLNSSAIAAPLPYATTSIIEVSKGISALGRCPSTLYSGMYISAVLFAVWSYL